MFSRLIMSILVISLLILSSSTVVAKETPIQKWVVKYAADTNYKYALKSDSYTKYDNEEKEYTYSIDCVFNLKTSSAKKTYTRAVLKFEKFVLKFAFKGDGRVKGKIQRVELDTEFASPKTLKTKFKVNLPREGGIVFKDKSWAYILKHYEKQVKVLNKYSPEVKTRLKRIFSPDFWSSLLNSHFFPVDKKLELPAKTKQKIESFEEPNNLKVLRGVSFAELNVDVEGMVVTFSSEHQETYTLRFPSTDNRGRTRLITTTNKIDATVKGRCELTVAGHIQSAEFSVQGKGSNGDNKQEIKAEINTTSSLTLIADDAKEKAEE